MANTSSSCEETVGNFKVTKNATNELGRGSYGVVYRGIRVPDNDPVAVKISSGYKQYMNIDEQKKEADLIMNKIPPHNNIVKVYDYIKKEYKDNETGVQMVDLWLVTELCKLGNLKKYSMTRELSIKQKVDLMFQAALGVQHLHECKPEPVVHRDIKPENILITDISGNHVVRLCDFGCARTILRRDGRSMTMKSVGVGTQPYLAPEQNELRDGQYVVSYHKSIDTFSLGVSNLSLLEHTKGSIMEPPSVDGKPFGKALYDMHQGRKSRHVAFNIDKSSDSELASNVKNVIKKMILYKPEDRISMREVVARLALLKNFKPTMAGVMLAMKERSVWLRSGLEWREQPHMPNEHPYSHACLCGVPGGVVVIGGWADGKVSSLCHYFSLTTYRWRKLPNVPIARCQASGAILEDVLMVLGGQDKHGNALDVCEKLHMTDEVWSSATSMMAPFVHPLVAVTAGVAYVIPQEHDISPGTQIQQYNPTTDSFSWGAHLPEHLQITWGACLVAADEQLLLLGGIQRLAIQYSPDANQWTELASRPPARYNWRCCGVMHGGKLLLCGDNTDDTNRDLVEGFDSSSQKWKTTNFKLPFDFVWGISHVATCYSQDEILRKRHRKQI